MYFFIIFSFLCARLSESNWSAAGYPGGVLQWAASYTGNSSSSGGPSAIQQSRVVVIHRDERGFGFVVAGDNPVFVQTVREGMTNERLIFFPFYCMSY